MSGDWMDSLDDEERRAWDAFVNHIRRDALVKIGGSRAFVSIVPSGEPDIKFAVELGLGIMLDKPLLVVAPPGVEIPEHLRRVADAVVYADIDTEEGQMDVRDSMIVFLDGLP